MIYWVELYNVEEGIFAIPDALLVDQYICTWMRLEEVETEEAVAQAIEQLALYAVGFDPAHDDQEILCIQ